MTKQQDNPKRPLLAAVLVVFLAVVAFAGAFYLLDGMSYVDEFLGTETESAEEPSGETPPATPPADSNGLVLPDGMSEEFALRMWQEQVDSQANIRRLAGGDVDRIVITGSEQDGDSVTLLITAEFADGPSADGTLEMQKVDDTWYFTKVTGMRAGAEPADTPVPAVDDVDAPLLSTIIEQQTASADVLEDYATGAIKSVTIAEVVDGPGTATLRIGMQETDQESTGDVVIVSKDVGGKTLWFVTRFSKTATQ